MRAPRAQEVAVRQSAARSRAKVAIRWPTRRIVQFLFRALAAAVCELFEFVTCQNFIANRIFRDEHILKPSAKAHEKTNTYTTSTGVSAVFVVRRL